MRTKIKINKGSDLEFKAFWKNENGTAIDLTGASAELYDATPIFLDHATCSITDAAKGEITVRMDWNDAMPMGEVMCFRIRKIKDAADESTNLFVVAVR